MTTSPDNFIDAKNMLRQVVADAAAFNEQIAQSIERITVAHKQLDAMNEKWKPLVDFINTAAADSKNAAYTVLKAESEEVVKAFVVMRNRAEAIRDAANAAK